MRGSAAFYGQELLSYGSFPRTSFAVFRRKRKQEYNILKFFFSKKMVPQTPKRTENYSSKYNDYRTVLNIAQNFGHVLCTRQI